MLIHRYGYLSTDNDESDILISECGMQFVIIYAEQSVCFSQINTLTIVHEVSVSQGGYAAKPVVVIIRH